MNLEQPTSKKFLNDLLKYLPSGILPALIGFLTVPLLTKIFQPLEYGNYILVISIISFLSIFVETLWGNPITRFFIVFKNKNNLITFYDTIILSSVISIVMIVVLSLFILNIININSQLNYLIIFGTLLFIFSALFGVFKRILIVREKSGMYSLFVGVQALLGFLVGVIFIIVFNIGIVGMIWGNMISFLIILPFIYQVAFKRFYLGKTFSTNVVKKFLKFGVPLVIGNLAAWILSLSDRYIIEFFKGSMEVGIYSASYGISEQSITVIWTLFMTASYPLIVRTWENHGEKATQSYITRLTRYFLLITIPAVIGLSVLAKQVIMLLTSPAYYEGYIIIPIILIGALFLGLQWWAQLGLLLHNKTNKITITILIAGIINILLNFILVPYYGFLGAAISTLISYFILFLIMLRISNKLLSWRFPMNSFIRIIISSVFMGLIVYIISSFLSITLFNLIILIIIGFITYFLILLIFKEFKTEEIEILKEYVDNLFDR